MLWNFEVTDGVSDPLKAMDRAFAVIEKDLAAVDEALDRLDKKQKNKAALADMSSALGKKGASALQAPDISAFGKKREASEQIDILKGATPEQAAAYKKTLRDFQAQQDLWEQEKKAQQHRAEGMRNLGAITSVYGKDVDKLNKQLAELEKRERLEQALAVKDPKQRHIALLRYQRDEMAKSTNEAHKLNSSLDTIKWLEIGRAAYGAAEKVYGLAKSFMHLALAEGGERKAGIRTLEFMLGDKKAAEEQWDLLELMSDRTKLTAGEMMNTYRMLFSFTQKYGVKATQDVIAAGEDINMVLGESSKSSFLAVVRNVEAMGKFDERSMRMLKEVGVATPEKLRKLLAEQRGVTEEKLKKLLSAGKISDTEGINAILSLVKQNLDKGGALGSISAKSALGSVPTQLKNIERLWGNLFDTLDTKPLAKLLENFAKSMDPATERGKKMQDVVQRAFDVIMRAIKFADDHLETFIWAIDVVSTDLVMFFNNVESGIKLLERLASALGNVGSKIITMDAAMLSGDPSKIWDAAKGLASISSDMKEIKNAGADFGKEIASNTAPVIDALRGKGSGTVAPDAKVQKDLTDAAAQKMYEDGMRVIESYADGMLFKRSRVKGAAETLAADTENALRDRLDMHSPSRLMTSLGENAALSFSGGFERIGPPDMMLPSPKFASAAELSASMTAAQAASTVANTSTSQSSKSISVAVDINVMGGHASAAQQWAEIQPQVRAEFIRLTESLAEED